MRLVLALNDRYARTPDGTVWTDRSTWHYGSLQRYLATFEQVLVVARVRELEGPEPGAVRADGPGITFAAVPYFVGPRQYLRRYRAVKAAVRGLVMPGDAVILRLPAWHVSALLAAALPKHHPYGVEVCGDAAETLAGRNPLRALMRKLIVARTRVLCRGAVAASYVTRQRLQTRYPCAPEVARFDGCSNVELPPQAFTEARPPAAANGPLRLLFIGSMDTRRKGADLMLAAFAGCVNQGLDASLELAGGGRLEAELVTRAATLGVAGRVRFSGHLPNEQAVREALDRADLFILPSRSEGLPRVLLEAMARGVPCIATRVGGIPELLEDADLVPPDDAQALEQAIHAAASDPKRRAAMSRRNLDVARGFSLAKLRRCRLDFQRALAKRSSDRFTGGDRKAQ